MNDLKGEIIMKIFFLICSMANAHGVERTLTDKINYMAEQGHDVTLVTYEQGLHLYAFELSPKVNCVDLDCRYFTLYKYSIPKRLKEQWKMKRRFKKSLRQIVDERKPDVLVTTTYEGIYMREIMLLSDKLRIVIESHTAFTHDMMGGALFRRVSNYFYLNTLKKCHLLIALTKGDAVCWQKHISHVISVPNAVSFFCEQIDLLPREKGRIIAVGRYHPQKRFDRLIDAFSIIAAKYPLWHIDIFGEGPDKEALQMQIDQLGLHDRIHLKPPTKDIQSEYLRSELFVFSSDYEGFGLVLIEAMACGVPPVSTDCPFGPSEIIEDRVSGLLCEMSVQDMADKMEWMISHDKERMQIALNAHQAVARYQKNIVLKAWEVAYSLN